MATDLAEVMGGAIALYLLFDLPLLTGGVITGAVSLLLLVVKDRRGQQMFERVITGLLLVIAIGFPDQPVRRTATGGRGRRRPGADVRRPGERAARGGDARRDRDAARGISALRPRPRPPRPSRTGPDAPHAAARHPLGRRNRDGRRGCRQPLDAACRGDEPSGSRQHRLDRGCACRGRRHVGPDGRVAVRDRPARVGSRVVVGGCLCRRDDHAGPAARVHIDGGATADHPRARAGDLGDRRRPEPRTGVVPGRAVLRNPVRADPAGASDQRSRA